MKTATLTKLPTLDYAGAEAFNTLSTNLSLCGANIRIVMVTSCHASEGKSFTSLNIARTLSELGHSVCLIDADLRRSMLTSRYGVTGVDASKNEGLVYYLAGQCGVEDTVFLTNVEGMYLVPAGRPVVNSLSLLSGTRLGDLMTHLMSLVTYIIVDAPPVGVIIDAAEIARSCDGALLVVGYNTVHRRQLVEAKQQIERTGCPILGVTLNNVSFDSYSNKSYYYRNYYSTYQDGYYHADGDIKKSAKKKHGKGKAE